MPINWQRLTALRSFHERLLKMRLIRPPEMNISTRLQQTGRNSFS